MPLNLLKKYPDLLEIMHLPLHQRKVSLRKIFDRDITFNSKFTFRAKQIRPTKKDGDASLDTVFNHLITEESEITDDDGTKRWGREFEKDRSQRLHWLRPHIDGKIDAKIRIFSVSERDRRKRKDVIRTYIYNTDEKYVIVLEPQRSNFDYYLLSAYYLNKKYASKQMSKKLRKSLDEVY